jgi:hypothetical protein
MKLKDFTFTKLTVPYLSIFLNDKEVAYGLIRDVLGQIPHLAGYEIKNSNYYLDDTFVIRL